MTEGGLWKVRYDAQRKTLHDCEDALAEARAERDRRVDLDAVVEAILRAPQANVGDLEGPFPVLMVRPSKLCEWLKQEYDAGRLGS